LARELFALRRDDVRGDQPRIDEALVEGQSALIKTQASDDCVYVPPDLEVELKARVDVIEIAFANLPRFVPGLA
jgi:hypothetical protein